MSKISQTTTNRQLAANALGVGISGLFAALGLAKPGYVRPAGSADSLTSFWAASSAVRTWAIAVPLLTTIARGEDVAPELLTAAGLVQLGDSALGVWQRNPRMAVLPAAMGVVHLRAARVLAGQPR